jgi:hypothetical protein
VNERPEPSPEALREAQRQTIGLLASLVHDDSKGTEVMLEDWTPNSTIVLATLTLSLAQNPRIAGGDVEQWLKRMGLALAKHHNDE